MRHKRFDGGELLIRIDHGEDVLATMVKALTDEGVFAGSFSAIGAVSMAEVGLFDPQTKAYVKKTFAGPIEIVSLTGNICQGDDGRAFVHPHVVISDRQMAAFGGHLFKAIADPTCEVCVYPWQGGVTRALDPRTGLKLLRF